MNEIEQQLKEVAPDSFEGTPVLFAYIYGGYVKSLAHPFSDLDIGIYVDNIDIRDCLDVELSLSLVFDEKLNHCVRTEVHILYHLPLSVKGRLLGEAKLIYSINEAARVAFEKQVRMAYFDFIPVIRQ